MVIRRAAIQPGTSDPVEMTGELLLEDTGTGTQIECSVKFDGTVGPGATGKIEKS
jgi:hypothetical protein